MRSLTHKVTFTFILDECEGSPTETLQEIVDLLFEDPMKRNLGRLMRSTTQITAREVDATDGGPCMWDTSSTGTDTDYTWDLDRWETVQSANRTVA